MRNKTKLTAFVIFVFGMFTLLAFLTRSVSMPDKHVSTTQPTPPAKVTQPEKVIPTKPAVKYDRVSGKEMRHLRDLIKDREKHAHKVEEVLDQMQKKNPDALAIQHISDEIEAWVKVVATSSSLSPRCFVLGITEPTKKKCAEMGDKIWGISDEGDIQVQ